MTPLQSRAYALEELADRVHVEHARRPVRRSVREAMENLDGAIADMVKFADNQASLAADVHAVFTARPFGGQS